ncbi:MAG: 50S ribosomal protein L13 [Halobacteriovoraceae bacterium]|nr:50S ribosomal protein L13 [Halobacteriovoraceae bacterium]|tara:strand:- start:1194 stop:1634 length:441 start_codon:yes stop_codon:yes gene_type:complete
MYTQKSFSEKKENIDKKWWIIDATDLVVGRVATEAATLLRGKHKPTFTPNQECGDFVVITNCEKIKFTGKKWTDKNYYWHTNHIGGIKKRTAREQMEKHPELIIMNAVKGMLPKNTLGRKQLTKLKVFVGDEHTHEAQKPEARTLR